MHDFEKYQKYIDESDYREAIQKLEEANIEFEVQDRYFATNVLNPGMRTIEVDIYNLTIY